MKIVLTLAVLLLGVTIAQAQHNKGFMPTFLSPDINVSSDGKSMMCKHASGIHSDAMNRPDGSAIIRRPYDVLKYDLFMDWRNPLTADSVKGDGRRFSGRNTITVRFDSAQVTRLAFNANSMSIDSVFMKPISGTGQVRIPDNFIEQPNNGEWAINLPINPNVGTELSIVVHYTHVSENNGGFFLFQKGHFVGLRNEDSIVIPERLAYTMSEPQNARLWMPCNDAPYDKAIATITVRVPFDNTPNATNFSVSSNGSRTIGVPQFDGSLNSMYRDFVWHDDTPIPTYLMVANASKFKEYSQWYKRVTNPNDSVEIINFVWQEDYDNEATDGSEYNARHSFQNVPNMMAHYSKLFGEYPFVKYGHTVAQPFEYGGMEHQTISTINRLWLRGANEDGIAHELMHQWTGDLTTCATWGDIWLNEGGATYGEALFYESWGGDEWYQRKMSSKKRDYLADQPQPAIYGIPLANIFNYATTYCKAGLVYGMLRKTYGDSAFFRTMRSYFNEFRFKSAETEDLLNVFDREITNPIVPFRTFFDQWLYSPGHPKYLLQTSQTYNGVNNQEITVTLTQTQSGIDVPEVFVMPVKITLFGKDNKRKVVSFVNDKRIQKEIFYTDFLVDSATIDENNEILCEKINTITSVQEDESFVQNTGVFPQPSKQNEPSEFRFSVPTTANISVSVVSILGQAIMSLQDGLLTAGAYSLRIPTEQLVSGVYAVRMTAGKLTQEFPLVIMK